MRKIATFCFLLIVLPLVSLASGGFETNWPNSPLGTELNSGAQIHELIAYIYEWGISLGGIAVFAILIIAGLEYIGSAGDSGKMSSALNRIKGAILGLILLLTSWLVLDTINPQLTTIRALPNLWDVGEYSINSLDLTTAGGIPCDYIVIWDTPNYTGGSSIIMFEENQETIVLPSLAHIMSSWANPAGILIGPIAGWMGNLAGGLMNGAREAAWQSVKGYRKISEQERNVLKEGSIAMDLYNEKGELLNQAEGFNYDEGNLYAFGGICQIKLYYSTSSWWQANEPCGNLLGIGMTPEISNVTDIKFYNKKVECIEISRNLPKKEIPVEENNKD